MRLLILGAGGHGVAVAEAAMLAKQFSKINFLDDQISRDVCGYPVLGPIGSLESHSAQFDAAIAAVGNAAVRSTWLNAIFASGLRAPPIIHPSAYVSPSASIQQGATIMPGAIVGARAQVGLGVIINCNSTVDHDCHLADFVHLSVGVHLGGGTRVESHSYLGAGCCSGTGAMIPAGTHAPPATVFK